MNEELLQRANALSARKKELQQLVDRIETLRNWEENNSGQRLDGKVTFHNAGSGNHVPIEVNSSQLFRDDTKKHLKRLTEQMLWMYLAVVKDELKSVTKEFNNLNDENY